LHEKSVWHRQRFLSTALLLVPFLSLERQQQFTKSRKQRAIPHWYLYTFLEFGNCPQH